MICCPFLHDFAGPQRVSPMHDGDLRSMVRQCQRLLDRRVSPSNDQDFLVPEKSPSHTAHAESPRFLNLDSSGRCSQCAVAPVAKITDRHSCHPEAERNRKGPPGRKSTSSASSSTISVPKRWACLFMSSIRSGPWMPSGKPGKFSTSVVNMSCPPGIWSAFASDASIMGRSPARAVYIAAVYPAGPEPTTITFRIGRHHTSRS